MGTITHVNGDLIPRFVCRCSSTFAGDDIQRVENDDIDDMVVIYGSLLHK